LFSRWNETIALSRKLARPKPAHCRDRSTWKLDALRDMWSSPSARAFLCSGEKNLLPAGFAPGPATTAATAARTSAAATAAEAVTAATATESAGARLARPRFIYRQSTPAQLSAVQRRHGFIRIRIHGHLDERETARLTRVPVFYNLHSIHLAVCRKCGIEILLCRLERNVPDINVLQGVLLLCCPLGQVNLQ
jgi:hypothetical protein